MSKNYEQVVSNVTKPRSNNFTVGTYIYTQYLHIYTYM